MTRCGRLARTDACVSNLHAAGAILGGAVPWKEKSGSGISVASGYAAADAIVARTAPHLVTEAIR